MGSLILLLALIFVWFHFKGEIQVLNARIRNLEQVQRPVVNEVVAEQVMSDPVRPTQSIPAPSIDTYQPIEYEQNDPLSKFYTWVKQDFMLKLGAFLLLMASVWFVSYAFAENWIGPMGRISLGLIVGAALLALGTWRISTFKHQGGIFTVLGGTVVILTLFAAREIYDFFTPASALTLMFFTVVFMTFVSVRYQSKSLAMATLLLGSIAPLLTNPPTPDITGLFTYLLIVAVGTLWVVWLTGWTSLILTSLIITYIYSLPFLFESQSETPTVMAFVFIFVSLYYGANIVSLVRRHGEGKKHMVTHTLTALGTAIFLVSWVLTEVAEEWQSLICVAWAIIFAMGTYVVYSYTANYMAFYLYASTSAALIGVATAIELSGPALTIAYILEISFVVLASIKVIARKDLVIKVSLLYILPLMLSLESLTNGAWYREIPFADLSVLLLMAGVSFAMGYLIIQMPGSKDNEHENIFPSLLMFAGGFYAVAIVWLVTHAVIPYDAATLLSLVTYTVTGILLMIISRSNGSDELKWAGSILIGLVIARLLLIDVRMLSLEGKVVTFLVLGALLVSTSFMRKLRD